MSNFLLKKNGISFVVNKRKDVIFKSLDKNYDFLIFDDGLQDARIDFDIKLVCFKSKNWVGNGQLIPCRTFERKNFKFKKFDAVFLNGDSNNLDKIENQIKNINSNIPIFFIQNIKY